MIGSSNFKSYKNSEEFFHLDLCKEFLNPDLAGVSNYSNLKESLIKGDQAWSNEV